MACKRWEISNFLFSERWANEIRLHLHATMDFFCGNNVSHIPTFLLSELWPAENEYFLLSHSFHSIKLKNSKLFTSRHQTARSQKYEIGDAFVVTRISLYEWKRFRITRAVTYSAPQYFALTKNDRLLCEARPACHKLKFPSPSAMPNLLPCCENRHLVTLANVPGERGVQTACWWPHSHICTDPSWLPVR